MKILRTAALTGLLGLSACAGTTAPPSSDVAACTSALLVSAAVDYTQLLNTALSTPACQSLTFEIIQQVVNGALKQNRARAAAARR